MNIKELQNNWNKFGQIDPLWSILTAPEKKDNKWEILEFFKTGSEEIDTVLRYVETLGVNLIRKKALDFGCGVGRLTQALGYHFDEVYGVDIAPSMIELAKQYNVHGARCRYCLNESDNLNLFSDNTFNFIYSNIVFQHMKPKYSRKYIKEFLRILVPAGLLIFQQPSREKKQTDGTLGEKIKYLMKSVIPSIWVDLYRNKVRIKNGIEPKMEMYEIKKKEVIRLLRDHRAKIIDIFEEQNRSLDWVSIRYCVVK